MKWEYFTAYCFYEDSCKICTTKAHWILDIFDNQHRWIQDGLNALGIQGWELVTAQAAYDHGGNGWGTQPPHWYIFKRPIA